MPLSSGLARELAEAILDAAHRAEAGSVAVGVLMLDDYFIATSSFNAHDDCVVIVVPSSEDEPDTDTF